MTQEVFKAWQRPQIFQRATGPMIHARRSAELLVKLEDELGQDEGHAPFLLAGPQDVLTVTPAAIIGRKPAPGTQDAEITRVAHVELAEPDLPWRYSPDPFAPAGGVKPWLVLVVGEAGIEVTPVEDNKVRLSGAVFTTHDLANSAAWAHVHDIPGRPISRILCPRQLTEGKEWIAALVPSWRTDGDNLIAAWDGNTAELTLQCFDYWRFRTIAEDDDFRTIAQRLEPLSTQERDDLSDSGFGLANIAVALPGVEVPEPLPLGGALGVMDLPAPSALSGEIAQRIRSLAGQNELNGRWVLTLPRYDGPWTAPSSPDPSDGWRGQLYEDPRHRGVAGLGAWAAMAWQDRISEGATAQAGDLALLAERVRNLGMGLRASRNQWRRVPEDPAASLVVLGPMLGRLPTSESTNALGDLANRTPWLVAALFSSAARRMLRPRSSLARAAAPGATRLPALLEVAASTCPLDPPPLPGQEDLPTLVADPDVVGHAVGELGEQASYIVEKLYASYSGEQGFDPIGLAASLSPQTVSEAFSVIAGPPPDEKNPPVNVCRPIEDLGLVAISISDAINPNADRPVIIDRVFDGVTGLRDPILAAPDLALELNIPMWSFLRDASPDWLLPGAGAFPLDRVKALQTNPEFVDAFLIGANQQSLAELRWRNVAITAGWTPLRRFWQRISDDGTKPATDIRPVLDITSPPAPGAPTWSDPSLLGDAGHQTGTPAAMLVILLHTELFRRYPATQVYLVQADGGWAGSPPDADLPTTIRIHPNLSGTLHPEMVFFGFPLPPAAANDHWLVLEEPPPGFRFRAPGLADVPIEPHFTDGAAYAARTLNRPIRAFFGNLL